MLIFNWQDISAVFGRCLRTSLITTGIYGSRARHFFSILGRGMTSFPKHESSAKECTPTLDHDHNFVSAVNFAADVTFADIIAT
mmetsp:Transcript_9150/g.27543  ORF Transcript_9150/g.27543 Transcript_9150/m.27543 type:complete len:84 (-) Transcript_9150:2329-2580(-)